MPAYWHASISLRFWPETLIWRYCTIIIITGVLFFFIAACGLWEFNNLWLSEDPRTDWCWLFCYIDEDLLWWELIDYIHRSIQHWQHSLRVRSSVRGTPSSLASGMPQRRWTASTGASSPHSNLTSRPLTLMTFPMTNSSSQMKFSWDGRYLMYICRIHNVILASSQHLISFF